MKRSTTLIALTILALMLGACASTNGTTDRPEHTTASNDNPNEIPSHAERQDQVAYSDISANATTKEVVTTESQVPVVTSSVTNPTDQTLTSSSTTSNTTGTMSGSTTNNTSSNNNSTWNSGTTSSNSSTSGSTLSGTSTSSNTTTGSMTSSSSSTDDDDTDEDTATASRTRMRKD